MKSSPDEEVFVLCETNHGVIQIKLYNETPKHRDNFIRLVEMGYYDSLLFHRVIQNFMIQGGDPDSRDAKSDALLGQGGPDTLIDAEFVDGIYHKRGALAAARDGDRANPERKSHGSQFYIVQGQVFDEETLDKIEKQRMGALRGEYLAKAKEDAKWAKKAAKRDKLEEKGKKEKADEVQAEMDAWVESEIERFRFTEEERAVYMSEGGAPHLDDMYTIFGEVVSGMDVVDSIAAEQTNRVNRPLKDQWMVMSIVR